MKICAPLYVFFPCLISANVDNNAVDLAAAILEADGAEHVLMVTDKENDVPGDIADTNLAIEKQDLK